MVDPASLARSSSSLSKWMRRWPTCPFIADVGVSSDIRRGPLRLRFDGLVSLAVMGSPEVSISTLVLLVPLLTLLALPSGFIVTFKFKFAVPPLPDMTDVEAARRVFFAASDSFLFLKIS